MTEKQMEDMDGGVVKIPRDIAQDMADYHKSYAKWAYSHNSTTAGDQHHGWARFLNDQTDREWSEVSND